MTPFESLLWNVWLPKVRSAINNEWSPEEPQHAVKLYEAWSTFIYAGQCTRPIDPAQGERGSGRLEFQTLQSAIKIYRFSMVTFCWAAVRRPNELCKKIKSLIRTWVPGEDIPDDLAAWREADPFLAPVTLSPAYDTYFRCTTNGTQSF